MSLTFTAGGGEQPFRTDRNRNPAAFTTDIAKESGLVEGTDYIQGDPFVAGGHTYFTARLLGDPVALTIKVIDKIGYYTSSGGMRWTYIGIPKPAWDALPESARVQVVAFHYSREGGVAMKSLFDAPAVDAPAVDATHPNSEYPNSETF